MSIELKIAELLKNIKADGHRVNGASQMPKRFHCSGSLLQELLYPTKFFSKQMKQGTDSHVLLERFIGYGFKEIVPKLTFHEEFWDVLEYPKWEGVAHYELELVAKGFYDILKRLEGNFNKCIWETEQWYDICEKDRRGGTLDFAAYWNEGKQRRALVWDFKSGTFPVSAKATDKYEASRQLIEYAIGLQKKKDWKFDSVTVAVFQPFNPRTYSSAFTFDRYDLRSFNMQHEEAANRSLGRTGSLHLNPGSHCINCSAKFSCSPFKAYSKTQTLINLEENMEVEKEIPKFSDKELVKAYRFLPYLKRYATDIENYIKTRSVDGKPVPDLVVKESKGRASWKKSLSLSTFKRKFLKYGIEGVFQSKPLSISAVKAELKKSGKTKEQIDKIIELNTERGEPSLRIEESE